MLDAAIKPYVGLGGHFVSFKRTFEKAENEHGEFGAYIIKDDDTMFLANKAHTDQQYGGGGQVSVGFVYDLNERVFIGTELALGYQGIKTNPYVQSSFFGNLQGSIGMRLPKDFQVCLTAGIEVDRFVSTGLDGVKATGEDDEGKPSPIGKYVAQSFGPATPSVDGSPPARTPSFGPGSPSTVKKTARKLFPDEGTKIQHEAYILNTSNLPVYMPSGTLGFAVSKKITDTWMLKIEGQLTQSFLTSKKGTIESTNHNLFFNLSQKRVILSVVKFL